MCIKTSKGCVVNKMVIFWQDYLYRFFGISEEMKTRTFLDCFVWSVEDIL